MKLLSRIALAISIVACIGALVFSNKLGKDRNGLRKDRDKLTEEKAKLAKNLADTQADLTAKKQELDKTKDELAEAKGVVEATKVALAKKTEDADKVKASLDSKLVELDQAKTERDAAVQDVKKIRDSLTAAGITDIKNIDQLRDKIVAQTEENQILGAQLISARTESVARQKRIVELTTTPSNLRGRIAAVQDNWGFVVLNLGRDQRVQTNADFVVSRNDKMISKVQVRVVGENTSVAEVLPGFENTLPRVGDAVVHY